jgi:FMN reductase
MHVTAIGGSLDGSSTTEESIRLIADNLILNAGATIDFFYGKDIDFAHYQRGRLCPKSTRFLESVRSADAVIIGSPGYHGTISGLVKNALDYIEELRKDERSYFSGLPVGCVSVAHSWPAAVNTLGTLRGITHSLRGWPTSMGLAINVTDFEIKGGSRIWSPEVLRQAELVGEQMASFYSQSGNGARISPHMMAN